MAIRARQRNLPQDVTQVSLLLLICVTLFSGFVLDFIDYKYTIPDYWWEQAAVIIKDIQIFGYSLVAWFFCQYKHLHAKVIMFLLCIWKFAVLLINIFLFYKEFSILTVLVLNAFYIVWCIRLLALRKIKTKEPKEGEAYFIFTDIKSLKGLLQAVFLPWHPPRYESRMICSHGKIYLVHHGEFIKTNIEDTNLKSTKGVKISLGRKLLKSEEDYLNSLIGKRMIPGIRDCRNFLKVG